MWVNQGYQLLRVDLTGSEESSRELLRAHFKELKRDIENRLGFVGLQYVAIETSEGPNHILHTILAWREPEGTKRKLFQIPQRWLSVAWQRWHKAPVVWVSRMCGNEHGKRFAKYAASHYLSHGQVADADGKGGLERLSWSWWRTPLKVSKSWEKLKRLASDSWYEMEDNGYCHWRREYKFPYPEIVRVWEKLLSGEDAQLGAMMIGVRGREVCELF